MKSIAFILDPDNNWIEILSAKQLTADIDGKQGTY